MIGKDETMRWKIEEQATIGVCQTSNKVREYSYIVLKSTKNKDTVLAVMSNKDSAEKVFQTSMHDLRNEMTSKKNPVPVELIMRKVIRNGTAVGRNASGIRIRWDFEEVSSEKIATIDKYSGTYARQIAKRKV